MRSITYTVKNVEIIINMAPIIEKILLLLKNKKMFLAYIYDILSERSLQIL